MSDRCRRGRLDFLAALCEAATTSVTKTDLYYQLRTTTKIRDRYPDDCLKNGLVVIVDGKIVTTHKGLFFIQKFKELTRLLDGKTSD